MAQKKKMGGGNQSDFEQARSRRCLFHLSPLGCKNGDRCRFSHNDGATRDASARLNSKIPLIDVGGDDEEKDADGQGQGQGQGQERELRSPKVSPTHHGASVGPFGEPHHGHGHGPHFVGKKGAVPHDHTHLRISAHDIPSDGDARAAIARALTHGRGGGLIYLCTTIELDDGSGSEEVRVSVHDIDPVDGYPDPHAHARLVLGPLGADRLEGKVNRDRLSKICREVHEELDYANAFKLHYEPLKRAEERFNTCTCGGPLFSTPHADRAVRRQWWEMNGGVHVPAAGAGGSPGGSHGHGHGHGGKKSPSGGGKTRR